MRERLADNRGGRRKADQPEARYGALQADPSAQKIMRDLRLKQQPAIARFRL